MLRSKLSFFKPLYSHLPKRRALVQHNIQRVFLELSFSWNTEWVKVSIVSISMKGIRIYGFQACHDIGNFFFNVRFVEITRYDTRSALSSHCNGLNYITLRHDYHLILLPAQIFASSVDKWHLILGTPYSVYTACHSFIMACALSSSL